MSKPEVDIAYFGICMAIVITILYAVIL